MLIQLKCPQCGASMEMDEEQDRIRCPFCGSEVANMKEKIEITKNVTMSGTVRHVMDRSNEPNLYISYTSAVPSVVMVVRMDDAGIRNTFLNGQTQTYHLQQGQHSLVLKIGSNNYSRTIVIPEDNVPVRINASFTGRRAEIMIDQPNVGNTGSATGQSQQAINVDKRRQSALAIISFVLSFLAYAAFAAVPLAVLDLVLSKKDKEHKHGLAIAALIIGSIMSIIMILGLVGGSGSKAASTGTSTAIAAVTATVSEVPTSEPEVTAAPLTTEPATKENESSETSSSRSGIDPAFQKAMDEYVAFFEQYCATMKSLGQSSSLDALLKTTEMLAEYQKMMTSFSEIEQSDLTPEELKLYLDTSVKIEKILLDVAKQ